MKQKFSKSFIEKLSTVTAKRPKTVIDHILKYGQVTTDELKSLYGYDHPPRAARDVREHGIGLKTIRVSGVNGRSIAAYVFDEEAGLAYSNRSGRTALSKQLKEQLLSIQGFRCAIYREVMDESQLQIDHRIPYEIAGNEAETDFLPHAFMLLCASANRAKSWSCESCNNRLKHQDASICKTCYWAFPENYLHVAMREERRLDLRWSDDELKQFEQMEVTASQQNQPLPAWVKTAIAQALNAQNQSKPKP